VKSAYNFIKIEVREEDRAPYERFWEVKVLPIAQITV